MNYVIVHIIKQAVIDTMKAVIVTYDKCAIIIIGCVIACIILVRF